MANFMIPIYVNLILKEMKTLEDVPEHLRKEVKEVLENGGYKWN